MWWVFGKEDGDESGSKPEESDSRVGSMHADSEPIGQLLLLKTLGPHSWVRVGYFGKAYPKRLSPARPVWVQTQPVATLILTATHQVSGGRTYKKLAYKSDE